MKCEPHHRESQDCIQRSVPERIGCTGRRQTFFIPGSRIILGSNAMDTATKNQISILSFIIGLIMLFIPYLKNFDAVFPGISQYFSLMFYVGFILIIVGYYLK
jgi:hypothetical protein